MKPTKEQLIEGIEICEECELPLELCTFIAESAYQENEGVELAKVKIKYMHRLIQHTLATIQQETERDLVEKIEVELAEVVQQYNEEFPPHLTAGMRKTPMSQREQYLMCQEAALKNVINSLTQEKEGKEQHTHEIVIEKDGSRKMNDDGCYECNCGATIFPNCPWTEKLQVNSPTTQGE